MHCIGRRHHHILSREQDKEIGVMNKKTDITDQKPVQDAISEAGRHDRTLSEQVEHWARIGRAIEKPETSTTHVSPRL